MSNLQCDPQHELDHARDRGGKGWLRWVTRLFLGSPRHAQICADLHEAEAYLNHLKWQQQLLATGAPARAIVRELRDSGACVNFEPLVTLELDIHADGHPAWQVTLKTPVPRQALPRVNEVIEVRYNPENTSEVALLQ